jgi:methylenetetrahydrofolate dehydrogenase (NADP+) / methenyltetrahydrofolate cyclohydrolase
MTATLIDGKQAALALRERIGTEVRQLKVDHGLVPGLAVVLVGDDPASQVYVRNKGKQCEEAGMASFEHRLPNTASQTELMNLVMHLNADSTVHGILVQLPLPKAISEEAILQAIDPAKDVDGFHPVNVGRLSVGSPALVPCTPMGCNILIRSVMPDMAGAHAVVIGRSNIVGKPMAQLLLAANCTVTIAHSRTRDLPALVRSADIVVAAVGKPNFVRGDWIKPGAVVIDVGINRVAAPTGEKPNQTRLVGDVAFDEASQVAGFITPVPGGVGPMTIACLLRNTVIAACRANNIEAPANL